MLNSYNKHIEPRNFSDKIQFDLDKPCIFVVYPPGASGDLLASIIDSHYLNTTSDYFGINETGQVIFRPSDYKITNECPSNLLFSNQWVYDIRESLSNRNKSYSNTDQMIFSNHLYSNKDIKTILRNLPQAKIIKIYSDNNYEDCLINYQKELKNRNNELDIKFPNYVSYGIKYNNTSRILHVPYGSIFDEERFENIYSSIVNFLNLNGKLIRFDFIKYYKSKQTLLFQTKLQEYLNYRYEF